MNIFAFSDSKDNNRFVCEFWLIYYGQFLFYITICLKKGVKFVPFYLIIRSYETGLFECSCLTVLNFHNFTEDDHSSSY